MGVETVMAMPPAFAWTPPLGKVRPVVAAVPHAGRYVPAALRAELARDAAADALADPFVDLLAAAAPAAGIGVLAARTVRSWLDLNRSPFAIDARVVEGSLPDFADPNDTRVRAGLGVLPRLGPAGRTLRRGRLSWRMLMVRLHRYHLAYHRALARRLAHLRASGRPVLLLDLHSTPEIPGVSELADIVLSDAQGTTASHAVVSAIAEYFRAEGLSVALNHPFTGGYTIRRHANPAAGLHAVQIECARRLYLAPGCDRPGPGWDRAGSLFDRFWSWLGAAAEDLLAEQPATSQRLAAE